MEYRRVSPLTASVTLAMPNAAAKPPPVAGVVNVGLIAGLLSDTSSIVCESGKSMWETNRITTCKYIPLGCMRPNVCNNWSNAGSHAAKYAADYW
jgi:hypothetical protein